ncbi:putative bifunctional diguanylate cyclase/phosphodiesterase [Rubrivivax gelatinosus]|uniref:putative bifunctional diguanylate cyclase/phosphodiesterase n=1 Tax=Rubrivivax gelatinosus TaxID=28068 RepID=UPI003211C1A8
MPTTTRLQRPSEPAPEQRTAGLGSDADMQAVHDAVLRLLHLHQSALDAISQGVLISDANRRATYVNAAFAALTGYSADEIIGNNCSLLQGPGTSPETVLEMRAALDRGEPFHGELLNYRKDGTPFWNELKIVPVHDERGVLTQFVGVQRDVTARRDAMSKLSLAARVFEHSNEALAVADVDGRFVAVNRAFTQITGYSEAEVVGQNPRLLKSGVHDENFYRRFWHELRSHGHWEGEIWNRRKDGAVYPEWLSVGRVLDEDGRTLNYIASFSDITERKHAEENVRRLAYYDALTGLPNRILLHDRAQQALQIAARGGETLALMFLDLDHFKNVNDTLGHPVGDRLLTILAQRMLPLLRDQDTLARVGGDEFVLVLPRTDAAGASHVAQKLLQIVQQPVQLEGHELAVTPSIGIALYPADAEDYDTLFASADAAMYRAKMSGRATFCFYTAQLQAQMARALHVENGLRRALERDEMLLHYQPQCALADGRIVGAEALLRWRHPELGWIPPSEFVPMAETSGQIAGIGRWVLDTALGQLRRWIDAGLPPLRMSVNLSAVQLRQPDLPEQVAELLQRHRIEPAWLELELTETVAWDDPLESARTVARLNAMGLRIAIDDFGAGYTSFSHLSLFRAGTLKIDRSLVSVIENSEGDCSVVTAIVNLARTLGMHTVAEGVETPGQRAALARTGCDSAQGWLFGRPVAAADFETVLLQHLETTPG